MIKRIQGFVASDGSVHASLDECKLRELRLLLCSVEELVHVIDVTSADAIAKCILANRKAILDILTTTTTSRPSARKANGGTKKRKQKEPELPLETVGEAATAGPRQ